MRNSLTAFTVATILAGAVAMPALAQEKTKQKSVPANAVSAIQVLNEARELCDRVAINDESVLITLDERGFAPEVDPFGEVPYYHEIEGGKDYPGVGAAEIWGFVEFYPDSVIGYCTFEILSPEIAIPVADLNSMDGLTGSVETIELGSKNGTYTSVANDSRPHPLLIHARQTEDSFLYQVTAILERD